MKKQIIALLLIVCSIGALQSCSSKSKTESSDETQTSASSGGHVSLMESVTCEDTLRPTGVGSVEENDPGGGSNYTQVYEQTADGDLTFVRTFSSYPTLKNDLYATTSSIPSGSTINNVTVFFGSKGRQTQKIGSTAAKVGAIIRENGVTSSGTIETMSSAYTLYYYSWGSTRPSDSNPWTIADITGLEFGVAQAEPSTGGVDEVRTTQVFVVVNYTTP